MTVSGSRSLRGSVALHHTETTGVSPEIVVQLYEVFQDDMPEDLRQLQNEADRWKARWEMMNVAGTPNTLDDTIQDLCPNLYTAVVVLTVITVISVSTATAERFFSAMRRLKNYLRSTMTIERMSGLVLTTRPS